MSTPTMPPTVGVDPVGSHGLNGVVRAPDGEQLDEPSGWFAVHFDATNAIRDLIRLRAALEGVPLRAPWYRRLWRWLATWRTRRALNREGAVLGIREEHFVAGRSVSVPLPIALPPEPYQPQRVPEGATRDECLGPRGGWRLDGVGYYDGEDWYVPRVGPFERQQEGHE